MNFKTLRIWKSPLSGPSPGSGPDLLPGAGPGVADHTTHGQRGEKMGRSKERPPGAAAEHSGPGDSGGMCPYLVPNQQDHYHQCILSQMC